MTQNEAEVVEENTPLTPEEDVQNESQLENVSQADETMEENETESVVTVVDVDVLQPEELETVTEEAEKTIESAGTETKAEITPTVTQNEEKPSENKGGNGNDSAAEDDDSLVQKLDDEAENEEEIDTVNDGNDIYTMEETDDEPNQSQRDSKGQSVLHFAAGRPGGAHTLHSFLLNPSVSLAWRDENLMTARDIAKNMGLHQNSQTIDNWIISLATSGELEALEKLMIEGYESFDISDANQMTLKELVEKAEQPAILIFLNSIDSFRQKLNLLFRYIRNGNTGQVKKLLNEDKRLAVAIGQNCRTALHVAVLMEEVPIVQYIAYYHTESLKRGDNLQRTPLHLAMGLSNPNKVEKLTRILVRAGAKRAVKDILGRQPSYFYINRQEIIMMQEEENKLKSNVHEKL